MNARDYKYNISWVSVEVLSLGLQIFSNEELLFSYSKHITVKVSLLHQAILDELLAM